MGLIVSRGFGGGRLFQPISGVYFSLFGDWLVGFHTYGVSSWICRKVHSPRLRSRESLLRLSTSSEDVTDGW